MQDGSEKVAQDIRPLLIGIVPETVKAIQSVRLEKEGAVADTEDADTETSEDDKSQTSAKKGKTRTEEEYIKVSNDLLSETGRRKQGETRVTKLQERITELEKDLEEETNRKADPEKPDSMTHAKQLNEIRRLKALLAQQQIDIDLGQESAEEAERIKKLEAARKVAVGYTNIDAEDLVGKTDEEMKAFCKKYGKLKGKKEDEESDDKETPPDKGVTRARAADVSKMSPKEKIALGLKQQEKKK